MRRGILAPGGLAAFVFGLSWLWVAAPAAAGPKDCTVTVEAGDTLSKLALRHGVSESALRNSDAKLKKNPNLLRVGQTLDICAAKKADKARSSKASGGGSGRGGKGGRSCGSGGRIHIHTIGKGDTLEGLADEYDVPKAEIIGRNAALKKNPNLIRLGQDVEVCVGKRRKVKKSKVCGMRTPLHNHEVVPGEHVGSIAGRYGVRRTDVIKWNSGLRNPDVLRVGQKLRVCPEIPPRSRNRMDYRVQSGDTLGEIAKRYGLTRREVQRFQRGKLQDRDTLREGQRLVLWVDGGVLPGFGGRNTDRGVLKHGIQLPPGRHYHVKWTAASWGTATTVRAIQRAVSEYQRRAPGGPKVHVGDLSKRSGGKFPPHISHQHGRDVDVGYVLKGKQANETRFRHANAKNLDVPRTWRLIKAFIDTNEVRYIFMDYRIQKLVYEHAKARGMSEDGLDELFQYPRGRGRTHGIIRHWKGHRNHFHVRFRQ